MKILGKILYGIVALMLISIAGLFAVSFVPAFGVEIKIVKSGSMEPAISTGSLVVVHPASTYGVGDVITFGKDTKTQIPTTHRIVAVREEGGDVFYNTKGDANEEADPEEVAASGVIGKVLFHIPGAGYVLDFARTPLGFALLIGLPAAILILDELFSIVQEVRTMRRRKRTTDISNTEDIEEVYVEKIDNNSTPRRSSMPMPKI